MESITSKLVETEKLRKKIKRRKNTEKMEQIERTK